MEEENRGGHGQGTGRRTIESGKTNPVVHKITTGI
jgi:hypothetical protein